MSLLTEEVLELVGLEGPPLTCAEPLSEDALRRFVQAAMEENPIHRFQLPSDGVMPFGW